VSLREAELAVSRFSVSSIAISQPGFRFEGVDHSFAGSVAAQWTKNTIMIVTVKLAVQADPEVAGKLSAIGEIEERPAGINDGTS
jgi:hypothetical protein